MLSLRKKSVRLIGTGALAMAFGAGLFGATYPASASPASFAKPVCGLLSPPGQPPSKSAKVTNIGGLSFGSGGLNSAGEPVCGGTVEWNTPPNSINPSLTGTLYMQNMQYQTARVLLTYLDIHGSVVVQDSSPDEYATSNSASLPVTINKFSDPRFYSVNVTTQTKSGSTYTNVGRLNVAIGSANHPPVWCTIDAAGVELGGLAGVSGGHPLNAAMCSWTLNPTSVQATINGDEYFENWAGQPARILISAYDVHGTWLGDAPVAANSPTVTGVTSFPALGSSVPNDLIYQARIVMQVETGGVWQQVGNTVTMNI